MEHTNSTCIACLALDRFKEANIWIHEGYGNYDSNKPTFDKYRKDFVVKHNEIISEELENYKFIRGMFNSSRLKNPLGSYEKPCNVLWFSRGSWLFDSFCQMTHDEHCFNVREKKPVVMIQHPKNILEVKTGKEFEDFVEKYCPSPEKEDEQHKKFMENLTKTEYVPRDIYNSVEWDKIRTDGFWGVSFDFRKVYELEFSEKIEKQNRYYKWHMGFDVESLCVWDLRAFGEEMGVYAVNLCIV
ncbi:MAG: hypothetical protein Terrestrivirus4_156 [Terrestrivirus sp.]|uniref:Uncharacterized protein n=1 Tax=Terrestrivirus sp. TaxID=2487775 RepID=A0A3G4ZMP5_9VIRU|nr:MAG: hypothetical protein Terrestrivirus4_156 [Terrestrivirus sp.]